MLQNVAYNCIICQLHAVWTVNSKIGVSTAQRNWLTLSPFCWVMVATERTESHTSSAAPTIWPPDQLHKCIKKSLPSRWESVDFDNGCACVVLTNIYKLQFPIFSIFSYLKLKKKHPSPLLTNTHIKNTDWCLQENTKLLLHCGCYNWSNPQFYSNK